MANNRENIERISRHDWHQSQERRQANPKTYAQPSEQDLARGELRRQAEALEEERRLREELADPWETL